MGVIAAVVTMVIAAPAAADKGPEATVRAYLVGHAPP